MEEAKAELRKVENIRKVKEREIELKRKADEKEKQLRAEGKHEEPETEGGSGWGKGTAKQPVVETRRAQAEEPATMTRSGFGM